MNNFEKRPFVSKSFLRNDSGNVIIMVALSALVLFAVAGAGLDFGRTYLVRNKAQQSADRAALAAAHLPDETNSATLEANRKAAAQRYYALNFPDEYMGVTRDTLQDPVVNEVAGNVSVNTKNLNVTTNFVNVAIGSDNLAVKGSSLVDIGREKPRYDVMLVLDNSESMKCSYKAMHKEALKVPYCIGDSDITTKADCTTAGRKWVPLGCSDPSIITTAACEAADESWAGCIDNPAILDQAACEAVNKPWNKWGDYCTDSVFDAGDGDNGERMKSLKDAAKAMADIFLAADKVAFNRMAFISWNKKKIESKDFTNNKTTYYGYIDAMTPKGATDSSEAMKEAKVRGAADFNANSIKVVILLTDGVNTYYNGNYIPVTYTANSPYVTVDSSGPDDKTVTLCNAIRDATTPKTLIYTVALSADAAAIPTTEAMLKTCADNAQSYYSVQNIDALKAAFVDIASKVQALRIRE